MRSKATKFDKQDFLCEAELMITLRHQNILQLIGLCITRKPWLLVSEFMPHKDLGTTLKFCKANKILLRMHELINYALQIAGACEHLEAVCQVTML